MGSGWGTEFCYRFGVVWNSMGILLMLDLKTLARLLGEGPASCNLMVPTGYM